MYYATLIDFKKSHRDENNCKHENIAVHGFTGFPATDDIL